MYTSPTFALEWSFIWFYLQPAIQPLAARGPLCITALPSNWCTWRFACADFLAARAPGYPLAPSVNLLWGIDRAWKTSLPDCSENRVCLPQGTNTLQVEL